MNSVEASFDLIVVLGAAVWEGGVPSGALRRRLRHATAHYASGVAPRLLLSGGIGRHPPAEAFVMRELALEQAVPAAALLVDDRSTSTLGSALATGRLMSEHGWSRVLVVTDRFHLRRSLLIFRSLGVEVRGSGPPLSDSTVVRRATRYSALREWLALPAYWALSGLVRAGILR